MDKKKGREAVVFKDLQDVARWLKQQKYSKEDAEPVIREEARSYAHVADIVYGVNADELENLIGKVLKLY